VTRDLPNVGTVTDVGEVLATVDQHDLNEVRELDTFADVQFVFRTDSFAPLRPEDGFGAQYQTRVLADTLLELHGSAHAERRRVESPLFRTPALVRYEKEILPPALETAIAELRASAPAGRVPRGDLLLLSTRVLLVVMAAMVGLDTVRTGEGLDRFEADYRRLDAASRVKYAARDPEEILRLGMASLARIVEEFVLPARQLRERLIAEVRVGERRSPDLPVDLLTLMLQNERHFAQWDEGVTDRETALYITGTVGTAANEICHAFAEIEDWIASHPEDAAGRIDVGFLRRAVNESVRLHGVNFILRTATEDRTVPSGLLIRAGQVVWLNVRAANVDRFGDTGDQFDPRRVPPGRERPYALAFGDGSHACIGRRFAVSDLKESSASRLGLMVPILLELYRAGLRRDPENSRTFNEATVRKQHATCPVILDQL
jgi:cytochrome P450